MLKKNMSFSELSGMANLYYTSYNNVPLKKRLKIGGISGLFAFMVIFLQSHNGLNLTLLGMFAMMGLFWNVAFLHKGISKISRTLPVKDTFVVRNILFIYPLIYIVIVLSIAFLLIFIIGIGDQIVTGDFGNAISDLAMEISLIDVWGGLFEVAIILGVWFLLGLQAFYRNQTRRTFGYIVIVVLIGILIIGISVVMNGKSKGVSGYRLYEIIYILPTAPTVAGAVTFAVISGLYAWKKSLYLYRHDVNGQKKSKAGKNNNRGSVDSTLTDSKTYKSMAKFVVVGCIVVLALTSFMLRFIVTGIFGEVTDSGEGEIHFETEKIEEYSDWNSYFEREDKQDVNDMIFGSFSESLIFPENIDEKYVTEYYASVDGDYSYKIYGGEDGGEPEDGPSMSCTSDIYSTRFMVVDYPKEDYIKECARIKNITYSLDLIDRIQTNHMLTDTENFDGIAYIAEYDKFDGCEYVITNDDTCRIIYVLKNGTDNIPTEVNYKPKKFSRVVPMEKRNYGKGYSIYQE